MTSSEKILSGILNDAEKKAEQIILEAQKKADEIIEEAEKSFSKVAEKILKDAKNKALLIKSTGKSGASLLIRDAELSCRREKIKEVLNLAVEKLNALDDDEYFNYLLRLVSNFATGDTGTMHISKKDLCRNTEILKSKLDNNLTLSDIPADIDGGFLLIYGDIEINAEFKALVHEKNDMLIDTVNNILFNET